LSTSLQQVSVSATLGLFRRQRLSREKDLICRQGTHSVFVYFSAVKGRFLFFCELTAIS